MKTLLKGMLTMTAVAMVGIGTHKFYCSYSSNNAPKESLLLAENIEALSESESNEYSGYAKDYETGEGLYVTKITGEVSGDIKIGLRITNDLLVQLRGKIEANTKAEWMMTCQQNMGCYTSCTNIDWRMGKRDAGLDRGC